MMRKTCSIFIFTCFFYCNAVLAQHTTGGLRRDLDPYVIEHKKKPRSIVDSDPKGSARSCKNEETILKWLPHDYASDHLDGHYHLLLSATDHQLPMLINWLSVAFVLGYLPSPRLLIHFHCDGVSTKKFVETHLLQECMAVPVRANRENETPWKRLIKDRLAILLKIVQDTDETDFGALTFDLDSLWIRNMISVFDYFGHGGGDDATGRNYDFISMGTIQEGQYNGNIITNFGGVFFKNSVAAKNLATKASLYLNSKWNAAYPDQDYVTKALFDRTNSTQESIPELSKIFNDEYKQDAVCATFPKTCARLFTGAQGKYIINSIVGHYMYLPQVAAPRECQRICSGATVLFQHCGIAYCLPQTLQLLNVKGVKPSDNIACHEIPEYLLYSDDLHKAVHQHVPHHGFKQAMHGVFDSRTQQHMLTTVSKFVDPERVRGLCRAYPDVCTYKVGAGDFNITVHSTVTFP